MSNIPTGDAVPHNVPSQTLTLVTVSAVFFAITTLFFATRLIWRFSHQQRGWDDLMATLAYITLVVQTAFGFMAAHYGFGKHLLDIPTTSDEALRWFWMYQICYKLIGGFTKLNFCFLYWRIFPQKNFQRVVIATGTIIAVGTLAFTIGTVIQCWPVQRNWNQTIPGSCVNFLAFWFSHAAFNTLMDIVVYILPLPVIRTLQMAKRTKFGLFAIFALGAFTIAASVVRMAMLPHSAKSTFDPTWGSTTALIWTAVEANTAVICCCLPALRSFAVQIWRSMRGKHGPETPMNSGPGRSNDAMSNKKPPAKSRGFFGFGSGPHTSKAFGLFSEARYSPPQTANDDTNTDGWMRKILPHNRRQAGPVTQGFPYPAEDSPRLELGGLGIYKATDVQVRTDWKAAAHGDDAELRELTFDEMLNQGPPSSSLESGARRGDRALTLKEILDQGPPEPAHPPRTRLRW